MILLTHPPQSPGSGTEHRRTDRRCAIDIRNVDVAAASAHGVLVTQASAGFIPATAEWVLGAMIDLADRVEVAYAYSPSAERRAKFAEKLPFPQCDELETIMETR